MNNFSNFLDMVKINESVYYSSKTELMKNGKFVERYMILSQTKLHMFDRNDRLKYTISYEEITKIERAPTGIMISIAGLPAIRVSSSNSDVISDIISQAYRRTTNTELKKELIESLSRISILTTDETRKSTTANYEDEKWAEFWKIRFSSPGINELTFQKFRIALELSNFVWVDKIIDAGLLTSMLKLITPSLFQQYLWTFRTVINSEYSNDTICRDEEILTFLAKQTQLCTLDELIDIIQIFSYICCQSSDHQQIIVKILVDTTAEPFFGIGKRLQINETYLKLNTFIFTFINIILAGVEDEESKTVMRAQLETSTFGVLLKEVKAWCKPRQDTSKEFKELWNALYVYIKEGKEEGQKKTEILTAKCIELEQLVRIYKKQKDEKQKEFEKLSLELQNRDATLTKMQRQALTIPPTNIAIPPPITADVPIQRSKVTPPSPVPTPPKVKEDPNAGGLGALDFSKRPEMPGSLPPKVQEDPNAGGLGALDFSKRPEIPGSKPTTTVDPNAGGLGALDFSKRPELPGSKPTTTVDPNAGGLGALDFSKRPEIPGSLPPKVQEDPNAGGLGALDFSKRPEIPPAPTTDINAGGLAALNFGGPSPLASQEPTLPRETEKVYNLPQLKKYKSEKSLKPIFWTPLPLDKIEESIWYSIASKDVKIKQDEIETLFIKPEKSSKKKKKGKSSRKTTSGDKNSEAAQKVEIFEGMRSQQIMFFYRNCMSKVNEFQSGLNTLEEQIAYFVKKITNMDASFLDFELAKKIHECLPDETETNKLNLYKDTPEILNSTEKFMLALTKVENLKIMARETMFMNEFAESFKSSKSQIDLLSNAYRQIQTSAGLKLFLTVLLNIGNICNVKNATRHDTYGFDISFFARLGCIETNKKGMYLLEYIYSYLLENYSNKKLFIYELDKVPEAQKIDVGGLMSNIDKISKSMNNLKKSKEKSDVLNRRIREFFEKHEKTYDEAMDVVETLEKVTFPKTIKMFGAVYSLGDSPNFLKSFTVLIDEFTKAVKNYTKKSAKEGDNKVQNLMDELTDKQSGKSQLDKIRLRNKNKEN